jgi:hypothetical protein
MSRHPEWCNESDDPQALELWSSDRPAMVTVWCGNHRHRIARVFSLASGPHLCVPAVYIRNKDIVRNYNGSATTEGHLHAALLPVDFSGSRDTGTHGRCKCGTYYIRQGPVGDATRRSKATGLPVDLLGEWTEKSPNVVQQ